MNEELVSMTYSFVVMFYKLVPSFLLNSGKIWLILFLVLGNVVIICSMVFNLWQWFN